MMSNSFLSNNSIMSKFSIFNSKNLFVSLSILLIFLLLQPITVTYVAGATSSWSDVEFEVTNVVWGNSDYLQDPNPGDNSVPLTIMHCFIFHRNHGEKSHFFDFENKGTPFEKKLRQRVPPLLLKFRISKLKGVPYGVIFFQR